MDYTEKTLSSREVYAGAIIRVHVDRVALCSGRETRREVVDHPGGVAVLPLDGEGNVYCVRQFRYPVGEHLLEVPAGKLDPGEEPLACAVRELSEETGFSAGKLTDLGKIYPSPGYCRETLYLYLAEELAFGAAHPDENEFLDVERLPLAELVRRVLDGEVPDAKTAVAVLKVQRLLEERANG